MMAIERSIMSNVIKLEKQVSGLQSSFNILALKEHNQKELEIVNQKLESMLRDVMQLKIFFQSSSSSELGGPELGFFF